MLVLAAAAAGQAKAEELNGELIALVREFKDGHVVVDRLTTIQDEYGWRSPEGQRAGDEISLLVKRGWEIRKRVTELAAKTPEGLAAKAWLALWETCDGTPEDGPPAAPIGRFPGPSLATSWGERGHERQQDRPRLQKGRNPHGHADGASSASSHPRTAQDRGGARSRGADLADDEGADRRFAPEQPHRAVRLGQMAARRQGPLVDFFAELGRQYYKLADHGPQKPDLRIEGGAD